MLFPIVAHIAIDVVNITAGIYVLWKKPRSIVNRSFFLFAFGIVGWSIGMMFTLWTGQFAFVVITLWSSELILLGFILFAEVFPEERALGKRFFLWLIPWFFVFFLTPSGLFVRSARFSPGNFHLERENGPLFPLFALIIGLYILWNGITFFKKYRDLKGVRRVQIRYFALGSGIFILATFVTDVLLPAIHIFQFNLLGPLFSIIFIGGTAYAIVRHEFMDIRFVVKRGISYTLLIIIIALGFFGFEFIVEKLFSNDEVVDIIAAVVGILIFSRLKRSFENITDKVFFRKDYDYDEALRDLGPLLTGTIDLRTLLASLNDFLSVTVKPERILFLFENPDGSFDIYSFTRLAQGGLDAIGYQDFARRFRQYFVTPFFSQGSGEYDVNTKAFAIAMQELHVAAIIPLPSREHGTMAMLLGEKLSDDIFRPKDKDLLFVLAHQAAMAIENAQLYEAVRRQNEDLEHRVRERTEKIRAMQEARSKFLTDISHELQTPVAIIKGNMEVLERKRKGERKAAMQVMRATLDRMTQMVNSLLGIERLNFSKEKLHKNRIGVENILEEAYNDCLVLAEDKKILLSYASEPIFVSGDKDKLKEVVLNLISNALKYTESGGTISLRGRSCNGNAEISVEDTGSGISSEELPHIFERFYRINKDSSSGTGLGLDICMKIIEAHGGTITAISEPGKGSRFSISLPIKDTSVRSGEPDK